MLTTPEIKAGFACGLRLMWLDAKSFSYFPADWRVMVRSFWVLLLLLPASALMTWYVHVPYYEKYGVDPLTFSIVRGLADALLIPITLALQFLFARSQSVTGQFPAYITSMNWLSVAMLFVFFIPWWLTASSWVPNETRTHIAIIMYLLSLFYGWFLAWRILKISPFIVVAFPLMADMLSTLTADGINHAFFGVARPFFDQ
jgi:hypothetical protein